MRHYIGCTPLLAFYALRAWGRWSTSRVFRVLFYALGAVSLLYALIGMRHTWAPMEKLTNPLLWLLLPLRPF
jgi:hypothetical protein